MEQKIGVIIAVVVFAVVGLVLYMNLKAPEPRSVQPDTAPQRPTAPGGAQADQGNALAGIERPIGEEERHAMLIAAVWLPPIQMEGLTLPQDDHVIHLEADIHATEGNTQGFSRGAWLPYLHVRYRIVPTDADKDAIDGRLLPMVAKDGPHYGATIEMPGPGKYKLIYEIEPPRSEEFGRHTDPVTGVDPWWQPFKVEFDFDYEPAK